MKRTITITDWMGQTRTQRMVNQAEIVAYLKANPGKKEFEIYSEVYGLTKEDARWGDSKYKYCLRRALDKGTVGRVKALVGNRRVFIYFAI